MNNATHAVGPDTAISPEVVKHVKAVAASMIGHAAFQKYDFDDICQDLFQQIILAIPKFDPAKSSFDTYACQIADRYKNRIYRERIYEKRDVPTIPFENSGDEPSQFEIDTAINNVEQQCLINDVQAIIKKLNTQEKTFCEAIMAGDGLKKAALGVGMVYDGRFFKTFLPCLREKFKDYKF